MMLDDLGRWLVFLGLFLVLVGGVLILASRFSLPLGRLPGDIVIHRDGFTCMFPIATSILLSILLTIVLNLIVRLWSRGP